MAFKVTNSLSVGITLYYFYKSTTYIDNYAYTVFDNNNKLQTQWENDYFKNEENGTRPILGILYAPEDDKYSVGLSLSKTFVFNANQYSQSTCNHPVASGANDPCYTQNDPTHPTVGPTITRTNVLPDYPTEVRLGWAYFPNKEFLVSVDLDYFDTASPDTQVYDWIRQPTINAAVGVEYYLNPGFAVRAGLYTDRSNIDLQGLIQSQIATDRIDMYGATLAGAWFSKGSSITLGLNYAWGSGDSIITTGAGVSPMRSSVLTLLLGTSYRY